MENDEPNPPLEYETMKILTFRQFYNESTWNFDDIKDRKMFFCQRWIHSPDYKKRKKMKQIIYSGRGCGRNARMLNIAMGDKPKNFLFIKPSGNVFYRLNDEGDYNKFECKKDCEKCGNCSRI